MDPLDRSAKSATANRRVKLQLLAFFLIIIPGMLVPSLQGNECDVVAMAHHFVHPQWIKDDWYLGQPVAYRYLFNFLVGGLTSFLPIPWAILTGRLAIALLFAKAIGSLTQDLKLPWYLAWIALFLFLNHQWIVAGEWVIGGLEAKAFAYPLFLLALSAVIRKKYAAAMALMGLGFSFHLLVGIYAGICLGATLILTRDIDRAGWRAILKNSWLFPVSGIFGFWAIFFHESENHALSVLDQARAALIYVQFRVPHHTLPSSWSHPWIVELCAWIVLFGFTFWKGDRCQKIISGYAIGSAVLFGVGLLLFVSGQVGLLRFYWFRFPDTILPLLGLLLIARLVADFVNRWAGTWKSSVQTGLAVLGIVLLLYGGAHSAKAGMNLISRMNDHFFFDELSEPLQSALRWIRNNTPATARFVATPFVDPSFYFTAERPIFVSWKFSPQSEGAILEWYRRIVLLNGGREPDTTEFDSKTELDRNFERLSTDQLASLSKANGIDFILTSATHSLPGWKPVYSNSSYAIYSLGP